MFDQKKYESALAGFKQDFVGRQWLNEKYKWEAVKWFQDHWDVNAPDFAGMLSEALNKTYNLLASMNNFPRRMIEKYAKQAPEDVRAMFIALFDETTDVWERIDAFKRKADELKSRFTPDVGQHYQNENVITTYLWLRYPDKYYIYKISEIRATNKALDGSYSFRRGDYAGNIRAFMAFYDEICEALKRDPELAAMIKSQLSEECYPDPEFKTMTLTFGFYISRFYTEEKENATEEEWFPSDYSPNITVEKWVELLNDETVFSPDCLAIMKRFKDYGGAATCAQLAVKYGGSANSYNGNSSTLAKRVAEKTGCPVMPRDSESSRWWPILYLGKNTDKNTDHGVYIWKLRDELSQALDQVDLSGIPLYAQSQTITTEQLHSDARFKRWFMPVLDTLVALGGEAARQIVHEKIIATYGLTDDELAVKNKSGNTVIINDIDWARNYLNYEGFLDSSVENGIWKLTDIGKKVLVSDDLAGMIIAKWVRINKAKRENRPIPVIDLSPYYSYRTDCETYDKSAFLRDVYISEARYDRLKAVLLRKKNIILQGAPGVGKTFTARRLAWSIMGEQDDSRIEFVQFHQNYSYEDFVMGYKPEGSGFDLKYGVFYRFCQKANNRPGVPHFFIIDEINRGNLSKIFGELLMLIEQDYRNTKVKLAYSDVPFSVPENLYIIGMMNTADRSLALIDYALRRRFSFFDMEPGFDSEGFGKYQAGLENETFDALIDRIRELNRDIIQDKALGKGFCIGHSYFCGLKGPEDCTTEWMRDVVDYDILQMLGEYWFDDEAKLQRWENILHGVFQ